MIGDTIIHFERAISPKSVHWWELFESLPAPPASDAFVTNLT